MPDGYAARWARSLLVGVAGVALTMLLALPVAAASYHVTDALGKSFEWDEPPERIVSLTPSITENLFAIGAGTQVVGVSAYSDYPPEAQALPIVADAIQVNLERLLELEPDLVVGDRQLVSAHLDRLESLGIPVFTVDVIDLERLFDTLVLLGELTGHEEQARPLVASLRARVRAVEDRVSAVPPEERPLVFVEVWNDPLMTAGPGSFIDDLVTRAGGRNLAHDAPGPWPSYSVETVIARNPEVILLTNRYRDEVLRRPAWQGMTAIQSGRVYEVDPDSVTITGPRLVDGLEVLAELFHPSPLP